MSFMDKRQHSTTSEQHVNSELVSPSGFAGSHSGVDQLPFPDHTDLPTGAQQVPFPSTALSVVITPDSTTSAGVTRQLSDYTPSPDVQTGAFTVVKTTTSLRAPIVIRATGKKSSGTMRPPQGRRMVVHVSVTVLLVFILLGTLLAVVPIKDGHAAFNIFAPITNLIKSNNNNTGLITQQAATATAVTQDGYDAGTGQTYAGLPTAPASFTSSYNPFYYGQCTYWADYLYHQLTGHWVPWTGSALVWAYGASRFGWVVSSTPHVPSIIVMQPGYQFAGVYGHVAVVERINADGTVYTSNMNWTGWAQVSYETFHTGPGIQFVWYRGA